jgi:hypothetical protein
MEKYIHVGLHKTGTTYLQKNVFRNIQNFNYVQSGRIKCFVDKGDKLIISNEAFSGRPYKKNSKSYFEQFRENFQKLKSIFVEFKVIIGFREPSSIISSFYKQYLQEGGTSKFNQFYNRYSNSIVNFQDLQFYKFYSYLKDEIGKKNIYAYTQNQLLKNEQNVLSKLEKFLGECILKVNKSGRNNVSVPDNLESVLLTLNKIDKKLDEHGIVGLNNKYFRKLRIAPRPLCQQILPKVLPNKQKRDLSEIKKMCSED